MDYKLKKGLTREGGGGILLLALRQFVGFNHFIQC